MLTVQSKWWIYMGVYMSFNFSNQIFLNIDAHVVDCLERNCQYSPISVLSSAWHSTGTFSGSWASRWGRVTETGQWNPGGNDVRHFQAWPLKSPAVSSVCSFFSWLWADPAQTGSWALKMNVDQLRSLTTIYCPDCPQLTLDCDVREQSTFTVLSGYSGICL